VRDKFIKIRIGGILTEMQYLRKNIVVILTSVLVLVLLAIWITGYGGLWLHGISYIANNTKEYTDKNGYTLPGKFSVSIDLSNLQINIGKEIYNNGTNKIYVSTVRNTGSSNSGGYVIGFRACGQYSLTNATLVSGVHHETVNGNSFTSYMSAKMTASYNNKIYNCSEFGTSGLNYRDGDDFAFYIFPGEAYEKEEVSLNEKGAVELTVTNLYINIWSKK
jgi:hypothetical protein